MSIGRERYLKNVVYVGGSPSFREGYGIMYLLGEDGMMYYYDYVAPQNGEVRDMFMQDVMTHCALGDGKMRISFVFASNIIHTLTEIIHPHFIGMNAELDPLPGEDAPEDEEEYAEDDFDGAEDSGGEDDGTASLMLAGTENVAHEAIGSVESIADTPIPFELWLFSIKKMGQNFMAATQNYERLPDDEKEALMQEYNETFGL